jgi:hypothetical protein
MNAVGDEGDMKKKHMVCLNWVLSGARLNPETELALGFLDHLMLGNPRFTTEKSSAGEWIQ